MLRNADVASLQGKATEGPYGEYCSDPSSRAGPQKLPLPGAWERERERGE